MNLKTNNENHTGTPHVPVNKQLVTGIKPVVTRGYLPPCTGHKDVLCRGIRSDDLCCSNTHPVARHALLSHDDFQYCWCIVKMEEIWDLAKVTYYWNTPCGEYTFSGKEKGLGEGWATVAKGRPLQRQAKMCSRCFVLIKKDLHALKTDWAQDLTRDGDVEANPGPHMCAVCGAVVNYLRRHRLDCIWRSQEYIDADNMHGLLFEMDDYEYFCRHWRIIRAYFDAHLLVQGKEFWYLMRNPPPTKRTWLHLLTMDGDVEANPGPVHPFLSLFPLDYWQSLSLDDFLTCYIGALSCASSYFCHRCGRGYVWEEALDHDVQCYTGLPTHVRELAYWHMTQWDISMEGFLDRVVFWEREFLRHAGPQYGWITKKGQQNWRLRLKNKLRNVWLADLSRDGDVEKNPGPLPRGFWKDVDLWLIAQGLPEEDVANAKGGIKYMFDNKWVLCKMHDEMHIDGRRPECDVNPNEFDMVVRYFEENLRHMAVNSSSKSPVSQPPTDDESTSSQPVPSSPEDSFHLTPRHHSSPTHILNYESDKLQRHTDGPSSKSKRSGKRRIIERATVADVERLRGEHDAKKATEAEIEFAKRQRKKKSKYRKSCPVGWRAVLDVRDDVNLGGGPLGGESLAAPFAEFGKFWSNMNSVYWPQGLDLAIVGWQGVWDEMRPQLDGVDVPVFLPGYEIQEVLPLGEHIPRKRHVNAIVGPLPYANHLAFFYNEMWTLEHYEWLRVHGYRPTTVVGEVCVYRLRPEAAWWTVGARFAIETVEKTLFFKMWWKHGHNDHVYVLVDHMVPNLFTNGTFLHDGSFTTACRTMETKSFSYVKYWSLLIHGTALWQSQLMNQLGIERVTALRTGVEFMNWIRPFVTNSRIVDSLYKTMFREKGIMGSHPHVTNVLEPVQETQPSGPFYDERPNHAAQVEEVLEDVQRVKEAALLPVHVTLDMAQEQLAVAVVEGNKAKREVDSWPGYVVGVLAGFGVTPAMEAYMEHDLHIQRADFEELRSVEEEWEMSSCRMFTKDQDGAHAMIGNFDAQRNQQVRAECIGAPMVTQMSVTAVQDGRKVSIYELPYYDPTRISVELKPVQPVWARSRPEFLYWIYFTRMYLPSSHAKRWAAVFRMGKKIPIATKKAVAEYKAMWPTLFQHLLPNWEPRSGPYDMQTEADFDKTTENMPTRQRKTRKNWWVSFSNGYVKDFSTRFEFFSKTDEGTFEWGEEQNAQMTHFDFHLDGPEAGKPRNLFNATNAMFAHTQGTLVDLKEGFKDGEHTYPIRVGGMNIDMPRVFSVPFHDPAGTMWRFTYGADTDNRQDSAWFTEAWNDRVNVHTIMGGDDNNTIVHWQGHRIEIETDVSMCDQSISEHFMRFFCDFMQFCNVDERVIRMIEDSFTCPGSYSIDKEVWVLINFLFPQLKTGVGHTSICTTLVVGSGIYYLMKKLLEVLEFHVWPAIPSAECIAEMIEEWMLGLGMQLKVKVFLNSVIPLSTFHKRYFVPLGDGTFTACSLPGTTIVKMCKVRADQPMNEKRFWKTLGGGALSRAPASHNPLVRILLNKLVRIPTVPIFDDYYKSWVNPDPAWAELVGDGPKDAHYCFMVARYGIAEQDIHEVEDMLQRVDVYKWYDQSGAVPTRVILNMWAQDSS